MRGQVRAVSRMAVSRGDSRGTYESPLRANESSSTVIMVITSLSGCPTKGGSFWEIQAGFHLALTAISSLKSNFFPRASSMVT